MKKLGMLLGCMMLAAVCNAGTVTWQVTGLKDSLPSGAFSTDPLIGAIAYLYEGDATDAAATAAAIVAETFTGAGALSSANTTTVGSIGKAGIGSYVSVSVTLYMVVFDAASIGGADYFMVSAPLTRAFGASGNQTFNFSTSMPAQWTPVPEPTSMALLALGVAAVGLRRKFRK